LLAKLYRVGLVTHKAPTKGFEVVLFYIFASLPKFSWRKDGLLKPQNHLGLWK
jgi:hypothetical protein